MFGSIKPGANAYAQVDIDTGVLAASPHKLTTMLFDAALLALVMAQHHMKANEIEKKGKAISRAIMMIESGLRASLNKEAGGAIAENLDALYLYMGRQLLTANLKNQPELLVEVHSLLTDLRATWQAIDPAAQTAGAAVQAAAPAVAQAAPAAKTNAYGALAPRASGFVYA
jgi:flagellar protein FliS